ncbi:LysR family transcriptional regulator [Epibacterium sp. SM1979]|uniref:LysR family transcriptional regulator n=1 Tax=Tritonibacter litoralis TaxID=2662264 RepID=A0A843YE96_9RHOB|nr:LysR substrate-binding domain-containing protein [Tritonibacter litoralis]MQQ09730.1 LysR family transcriptional regulator [Tritonibacter litoralis]
MDTRFLSSLVAVVEEGSFAAAARREHVTASAIAQRVTALEGEMGVELLRRAGRVVQPTEACRNVLPQVRQILRETTQLQNTLRGAVLSGRLRLGAVSTAMWDYAGPLLRHMNAEAPDLAVQLVPGTSQSLYEALEQDVIDAALLVAPPFVIPKAFAFFEIVQQPIGVLRPADARSDLPYLVYSREAWGGAQCWALLEELTAEPEILAEMDALEVIAQLVAEGAAQAVLPQWRGLARHASICFTPYAGHMRPLGVLCHQRDADSKLIALLCEGVLQT